MPGASSVIGKFHLTGSLGSEPAGWLYQAARGDEQFLLFFLAMDLGLLPEFAQGWLDLAQSWQPLRHAGLIRGVECGRQYHGATHQEQPYVVVEHHDPRTTLRAQLARQKGALGIRQALGAAAGLAEGVASVHAAGLHHGWVHPSAVVAVQGAPLRLQHPCLAWARRACSSTISQDHGFADYGYISPEVATGGPRSPASDQFAVGAIAFLLLTGRSPFADDGAMTLDEGMIGDARDPRRLRGEISAEVSAVLHRAMAWAPAARFPDCADLAAALRTLAVASPPSGRNEPAPQRPGSDRSATAPSGTASSRGQPAPSRPGSDRSAPAPRPASGASGRLTAHGGTMPGSSRIARAPGSGREPAPARTSGRMVRPGMSSDRAAAPRVGSDRRAAAKPSDEGKGGMGPLVIYLIAGLLLAGAIAGIVLQSQRSAPTAPQTPAPR